MVIPSSSISVLFFLSFLTMLFNLFVCFLFFLVRLILNGFGDAGLALLEFRARIDSDPYGAFANWNSYDSTPCMWLGVHCVDSKVQML